MSYLTRKRKYLFILTALLALVLTIPSALSYFTTYTQVDGSKTLKLKDSVVMWETGGETSIKHVMLEVDPDSDPVFVRVAVFAPTDIEPLLEYSSEHWVQDGIYYQYDSVLYAGDTVEFTVDLKQGAEIPRDNFKVVVVYEYTPALGVAPDFYPDWEATKYTVKPDPAMGGD